MKKLFRLGICAVLATALITSCKKNNDDVIVPVPKKPYLQSSVQNTHFGRDSMLYKYSGNTITGMDYYFSGAIGGFYNYVYQVDSNVVWWSWNTGYGTQQYSYTLKRNADKIVSLTWSNHDLIVDIVNYKALFKYNNNRLDSIYFTEDYQGIFQLDTSGVFKITYTGDDITKIASTDLSGGNGSVRTTERDYTYDNTPNGFAAVNKNYWLLGYNYKNTETFNLFDVIVTLSVHNVTSEKYNNTTTSYTYTKDAQGNIIASSGGGIFHIDYR